MRYCILLVFLFIVACDTQTTSKKCGDNIIDPGEACDGFNLGGTHCQELGYYGGALVCSEECTLDTSACEATGRCGDGEVQPLNESCDGPLLTQSECSSIGYGSGTLGCTAQCRFDLTDCEGANVCGNGVVNAPEECDGEAMSGKTCRDFFDFVGGELRCGSDCRFDYSGCYSEVVCGDGRVDGNERCDGANMGGLSCTDFGFEGGILLCQACRLSAQECEGEIRCGDGVINGVEECDGTDFGKATCLSRGYYGGSLVCRPDCTIEDGVCEYYGACGDGVVQEEYEECDRDLFGGATCLDYGFNDGTLKCTNDCVVDISACTGGWCGDGVVNGAELCDATDLGSLSCEALGYHGATLSCKGDCTPDTSSCDGWCGDGVVQGAYEACDTSVAELTCAQFGRMAGSIPVCRADCTPELSQCSQVAMLGSTMPDSGAAVVVDGVGNIYLAGETAGNIQTGGWGTGNDFFLSTFSASTQSWSSYQDFRTSAEYVVDLAADGAGDLLVLGTTDGTMGAVNFGATDFFVARFTPQGTPVETFQFGGTNMDTATAMVVDAASNIFIAGETSSALGGGTEPDGTDAFLMKLNSAGQLQWVRRYDSSDSFSDAFMDLALDGDGNLYAIGHTTGDMSGQGNLGLNDAVVMKLTSDGTPLWTRTVATAMDDYATGVTVTSQGRVFVSGSTYGVLPGEVSGGGIDLFWAGFTADGTPLFAYQYGGVGDDEGVAVVILGSGEVMIAGNTTASFQGTLNAGGTDFFTITTDQSGQLLSVAQFGEMGGDRVRSMTLAPNGAVYVAGVTSSNLGGEIANASDDAFVYSVHAAP